MKNDDPYISILRFGRDRLGSGLTFNELIDHLEKNVPDYEETPVLFFFAALFVSHARRRGNPPGIRPSENEVYFLNHEGYFKLLEYEELSEARHSSKIATRIAIAAIIISIVSTSASVYFSIKQIASQAN